MNKIVLIAGPQACGKTTFTELPEYRAGVRVNRDLLGNNATMKTVLKKTEELIARQAPLLILDNTFLTAEVRKPFVELAKKSGYQIEIVWVDAKIEECQFNACMRMMERYGKILTPEEIKASKDPNMFPTAVLFKAFKTLEKPKTAEGFDSVQVVKNPWILDDTYCNQAVILDYDGTLREVPPNSTNGKYPVNTSEVCAFVNAAPILPEYRDKGYLLLGVSNQSGIAKGHLTEETARECFEETNRQLGCDIEYLYCPHRVPPVSCYCRKPMPGLGVQLIHKHKLDPAKCIMVGDLTSDKTFAKRSRFGTYYDVKDFFKGVL